MTYDWDFSFLARHKLVLWNGLLNTGKLTLTVIALSLAAGLVIGAARSARAAPVRILATCYVETFRNVPALILVFWFYFAVPILTGIQNDRFLCAAAALTLYGSAYFAEIFRSGIQSVGRGQWEAARALGFGYGHQMRYVVLPQAVRRIVPTLTNECIEIVKLTSLASTIAYAELVYHAKILSDLEYRPVEAYTAVAAIFMTLLSVLTFLSRRLERSLGERHV